MTKFMNAELIAIRDSLLCGHCAAVFQGSDSQAWKVKYEKRTVYCTDVCRIAAIRNKLSKPIPNRGPCGTCGTEFFSRTAKQFCSMGCYTGSKMFSSMLTASREKSYMPESIEKRAAAARKGIYVKCLECADEFYQKRQRENKTKKKYCSTVCYRAYMSKRFDRWIANPKGMALPQCYDEFLDRDELDCIVEGCQWWGRFLSVHINLAHGIEASEFKRAAGFNINSGIVSKDLAQALRERANVGIALRERTAEQFAEALALSAAALKKKDRIRYRSKEAVEHTLKAFALKLLEPEPIRCCVGCGNTFRQTTSMGRQLYCSVDCRTECYAKRNKKPTKARARNSDGTFI